MLENIEKGRWPYFEDTRRGWTHTAFLVKDEVRKGVGDREFEALVNFTMTHLMRTMV